MAAIRDFAYGGIAIDGIRLSPNCRKASGKPLISLNNLSAHHPQSLLLSISILVFFPPPPNQRIAPCQNSPNRRSIRARKQTRCVTSKPTVKIKRTKPNVVRLLRLFLLCSFLRLCRGFPFSADLLHLPAGNFFHPEGSSGWTDSSIGRQGWDLYKNSTTKGTKTRLGIFFFFFVSLPPRD